MDGIAELYEQFEDRLYRFALSLCHDVNLAEDLTQDTFMRAFSHLDMLKKMPNSQKKSWLFAVMKNLFIDFKRREKFEIFMDQDFECAGDDDPETHTVVMDLLGNLPEKQRSVVFRKFWLGMSSAEVSRELGIPAGTIRYLLHNALEKTRQQIR